MRGDLSGRPQCNAAEQKKPPRHRPWRREPLAAQGGGQTVQKFSLAAGSAFLLAGLAGTGRNVAQSAYEIVGQIVTMRHEMPPAFTAGRVLEHLRIEKPYQGPGARQAQHTLHPMQPDMVEIHAVGLEDALQVVDTRILPQVSIERHEKTRVNVRLPGCEPVGGKGQHALGRRFLLHFLVQLEQPFARKIDFRLEHLHPRAEFDHLYGQADFARFRNYALDGHFTAPSRSGQGFCGLACGENRRVQMRSRGFAAVPGQQSRATGCRRSGNGTEACWTRPS